jgi:hypothetical protein
MTENQATTLIVLLSIPVGIIVLMFAGFLIHEHIVVPVSHWRDRRRHKKNEPVQKLQDDVYGLKTDFRYLRQDVNKLISERPAPAAHE